MWSHILKIKHDIVTSGGRSPASTSRTGWTAAERGEAEWAVAASQGERE